MKLMLVDDETFILQGLSVLINWEAEGYEIVKMASNGKEAYDYLKENEVDLILADIRMPVMTGLELLEAIRTEHISDAYFVILSGYSDFKYAQQAIRFECMDYILKPVQKDVLLEVLHKASSQKELADQEESVNEEVRQAMFIQNLVPLMRGKYEQNHIDYVREHMRLSKGIRYIHLSIDSIAVLEELSDEEILRLREKIYQNCRNFLERDADHCLKDLMGLEEEYELGFIYCDYMAEVKNITKEEFLEELSKEAGKEIEVPVALLVGKQVEDITKISRSYSTACVLRSFHGFQNKKNIYYYDEEIHVTGNKVSLCKQSLDQLITAIEQNNRDEINKSVDALYQEMEISGMKKESVSMNINYLLFQLIHLAVEQDESINQEEVMLYISENVFDAGISRGDRAHLRRFAYEYADYLIQVRKNVSRGVLLEIEKEIKEHFADNLTLRELSKKYFINSSYLGQLFRKKYGQSFKDYLCNYRINEAAQYLLKTDDKISRIAEQVGYHDTDYFISRFIEQKGCTPARYRRNSRP
ncbi:MAG: response regulator [Clostridia bacterium]|nr:response regulator [Clostridia bacterium]